MLPGGQVHIPDPNLRAAVAEALGKSANAPITAEEMKGLRKLHVHSREIQDLTGLQHAANLEVLNLPDNNVSDLSPLAGLINLRILWFGHNNVSDVTPLARLVNLTYISFNVNEVFDISPFARLVNLKTIISWGNPFSDLSSLAGLTKLERVDICGARLEGASLAPLGNLTGLKELYLAGNGISDVSPLAGLTGLTRLELRDNHISDISPLAGLTNLEWLNLLTNDISDISPVAGLSSLKWMNLHNNKISDISALAGLTNLTWLDVAKNEIADLSPLNGLRENAKFLMSYYNPGFPKGGPKIEGPWLWVFLPGTQLEDTDLLSEASGGTVTEVGVATRGATVGNPVGDDVWISDRLPPTGRDNLDDMLGRDLPDGVMYGTVSVYSPRAIRTQPCTSAAIQEVRVWLNGRVIYSRQRYIKRRRLHRLFLCFASTREECIVGRGCHS